MRVVKWLVLVVTLLAIPRTALCDEPDATEAPKKTFSPRIVGDLRAMVLVRSSDNYFQHAGVFRYDMGNAAGGVSLAAGVELVPRLSVFAVGHYLVSGADRDDAHLRLYSGGIVGLASWSFYRFGERKERSWADLALVGGFGRYVIRETYVNPALSPQSFTQDDGAFGADIGTDASIVLMGFRVVAGYAFSYSPASIADRIGGKAYAGGHQLSIGLGVAL